MPHWGAAIPGEMNLSKWIFPPNIYVSAFLGLIKKCIGISGAFT